MITMVGESAERSRSHGLRPEVLDAHADRLGLRRVTGRCTWQTYEAANSPLFSSPLHVAANGHVPRSGCWALDLNLKSEV